MTENDRFKIVRRELGLNQDAFAKGLGIKQGSLSDIERGKVGVSDAIKFKLRKKYNIDIEFIEGKSDNIYLHEDQNGSFSKKSPQKGSTKDVKIKVDYLNKGQARDTFAPLFVSGDKQNLTIVPLKAFGGFLMGYRNKVYLDSLQKTSFPWVQGECFAFEVEGFSMMPDYIPQSFVVTTQLEKLEYMQKGKDYVFQTIDGLVLKRFVSIKDTSCNIVSINEEYNPVKSMPLKSIKGVFFIEYKINKP